MKSARLNIEKLKLDDISFIYRLVNTEGWLKFIGDRNVHTLDAAKSYVINLINNDTINYWVVHLKDSNDPIGVITLIKKEYLDHPDLGFAFLPEYENKGYAFESASIVLEWIKNNLPHQTILACTNPANISSIKLIDRLGMRFRESITNNECDLMVY